MIDLHSHILPGIDDGAADMDESLAMARIYVDAGVSCVVATPHVIPGTKWKLKPKEICDQVNHLPISCSLLRQNKWIVSN